ncbi:lamin tail domain-containing protein [Alistipes sp. kh20]|uniref:DUF6443 domain-containing protein n=1 Tax=Alistipes montrealensis TaxID=2834113 RepID=UPI001BCC1740|nr:DUF6443 domain-containing protein [Alistipes montrealensis]MBS4766320.1 lamin tail domain-containing protein [Alistipes montrealensis]
MKAQIATICILLVLVSTLNAQPRFSPRVIISEIMYDTPLNEVVTTRPYSNGEFLELYNCESAEADISGWMLKGSGVTEQFRLPDGTVIPGRGTLVIAYCYAGSNFLLTDLYSGLDASAVRGIVYQNKIILANGGEEVQLSDKSGVIKDRIYYDGTSNRKKPDRLEAANSDTIGDGSECSSLQRITADFDDNACAIGSNTDWITARTTPFQAEVSVTGPDMSQGANWIETRTATAPGGAGMVSDIRYFNGLGLPVQDVSVQNTPQGRDLVTPIEYDAVLRDDARSYLPYPAEGHGGVFRRNAIGDQSQFYRAQFGAEGARPYSVKEYEPSPLGRVRRTAGPGMLTSDGSVKYVSVEYLGNGSGEVLRLKVDDSGNILSAAGYYPEGTLCKTQTLDEDGNVTRVFANQEGLMLLNRVFDSNGNAIDTYSVYDDMGRLRWVVSPEGAAGLGASSVLPESAAAAQEYCYVYKYDGRGNVIEKKLPGRAAEYLVYDRGDRLVMSQDGNLRAAGNRWTLIGYDAFDRESTRRILPTTLDRAGLTEVFAEGRESALYDSPSAQLESQCFYDSSLIPAELEFAEVPDIVSAGDIAGSSLRAYEKIRILNDSSVDEYVERAFYYDKKGRVIQTVIRNQSGGVDRVSYRYDFCGNVLLSAESHRKNRDAEEDVLIRRFTYDSRGRLLAESACLNDGAEACMNYGYDELGNLTTRRYGGDNQLLAEELSYNLRGWLTSKSNEKFSMTLAYNAPHHPQVAPSYTGNITEWNWTHADSGEENTYSFTYDSQSRLTDTRQYIDGLEVDQFVERNLSYDRNGNIQSLHRYEHGELKSNFAYTYTGNRLKTISDMQASPRSRSFANWGSADSLGGIRPDPIDPGIPIWPIDPVDPGNPGVIIPPVIDPVEPVDPTDPIGPIGPDNPGPGIVVPPGITDPTDPNPGGGIDPDIPSVVVRPGDPDKPTEPTEPGIRQDSIYSGSEYVYDVNGNMLYDPMEGLNIRYNHLNLIEKVLRGDTIVAKYSYLSDGTKLSATDADGNGLYYLGSLVYGSRNGDLSLESAAFNGGRFIVTSNGIESHYFVTDHLGSVRAVVNNDGEVIERNDYYPFGLRWNAGELSDNRYRYNGKEEQSFVNFPSLDYGARMFDTRIGRFKNMDKRAEKYYYASPFAYCLNNPVNAIDPDGNLVIFINGRTTDKNEQGKAAYWRKTYKTMSSDFAGAVMSRLNDYKSLYKHGGNSIDLRIRYSKGYQQALIDVAEIIELISDENGHIVETIKIITHSMGAAYGKGYAKALQHYFKENNIDEAYISLVADFDPYQASGLIANPDIYTLQFTHIGGLADQRQKDLPDSNYFEDNQEESHRIMSFWNDVFKLPQGTYIKCGDKWVRKN